jgi:FdhD protein
MPAFQIIEKIGDMQEYKHFPIVEYRPILVMDGEYRPAYNPICQEFPLEIRINGTSYVTLMRTPGQEKELAVGFCFTDDIISQADEITIIREVYDEDSFYVVAVELVIPGFQGRTVKDDGAALKSSSGSVNRTQILEDIFRKVVPIRSQKHFKLGIIDDFPEQLGAGQVIRSKCGATHASALFDTEGTRLFCAEDVGRHNGLDKLIGHVLLQKIDTSDKLLMLSSRASFEMIQKAIRISIPGVASVSAPTELALKVAEKLQCTYISFLKKKGFYIYTHPWRFGL